MIRWFRKWRSRSALKRALRAMRRMDYRDAARLIRLARSWDQCWGAN